MLPFASTLLVALLLLSPTEFQAPPDPCAAVDGACEPALPGRVTNHVDLNGDGASEVFVVLPGGCDPDGRCMTTVLQPHPGGGYRVLLPPTRMWDLSPSDSSHVGFRDLTQASREGTAMDDITLVQWVFDGRKYRPAPQTWRTWSTTPAWLSTNPAPRAGLDHLLSERP